MRAAVTRGVLTWSAPASSVVGLSACSAHGWLRSLPPLLQEAVMTGHEFKGKLLQLQASAQVKFMHKITRRDGAAVFPRLGKKFYMRPLFDWVITVNCKC